AVAEVTPAFPVVGDTVRVPVLGLTPEPDYRMTAIAYGACGQIAPDAAGPFRTEELPADLPRFSAGGSDPSPGFVAFAAGDYAVIIDNTGRVVWYHRFGLGPGLNFQPQPNGRFVARPPSADPEHHWIEIDPSGRITRTFGCLGGQPAR